MLYQDCLLTPRPAWIADALGVLARHRFATARQLAATLDRPAEEITTACSVLVRDGALRELRASTFATRDADAPAYALTNAGLALVPVDVDGLRPRATRSLRSAFSLAHELLVNEFALVLESLDRRGEIKLLSWQTARDRLSAVTSLADRGRAVRVPLVADGLAVVERHGERLGLMIEADLGTVSTSTMMRKYRGYVSWWLDGGPTRRFGLPATRVVTLAPAPRRLERLRTLAIDALAGRGSGLLWFLPHDAIDVAAPERLLAPTATVAKAGEEAPRPLFRP
jgi:hypothetical protein